MRDLSKIKAVIKEHISDAKLGIFDCAGDTSDIKHTIYNDGKVSVHICYVYECFEVYGLTQEEFAEIAKYYISIGGLTDDDEDDGMDYGAYEW